MKHKPSESEAAALVQCTLESQSNDYMGLYQKVSVSIGGSRAYQAFSDSGNTDIDTTAPLYPIRGSMDQYECHQARDGGPESACLITHMGKATGSCYKTTFADWHCNMMDFGPPPGVYGPAPKTY